MIPIYLIVAGAAGLFCNFANVCYFTIRKPKFVTKGPGPLGLQMEEKTYRPLKLVTQLFLFAWFVCGNVWIYSNYEPNYTGDPGNADYCHKTLYLFAFWVTNTYYIIFGIVMVCVCATGLVIY